MLFRALLFATLLLPWPAAAQSTEDCEAARLVKVLIQTSAFPALPGQEVTLRVFVEPVQGTAEPTGDVQLFDGATGIGTLTLKQAQGSFTRTFLESGAHVLQALYSGDLSYCSVTGVFGQQVDHLTPTVTLAATAATASVGGAVRLTAQIAATVPKGVAAPSGPVRFMDGTTVLGSVAPVGGTASLTPSNLSPGTHQIVAVLIGDLVWFEVRSAPFVLTVGRAATLTTLSATAGIASTTLGALVTAEAGSAVTEGTVQFVDTVGNVVLGTTVLPPSGAATVTLSAAQVLASVGHPIDAVYSGSANFAPSTSVPIGIPVAANSTGAASAGVAPGEIVSLYGWNLSATTVQAAVVPLPLSLDGYRVTVTDSAGDARSAGLYLISPTQFNFVMPPETAPGAAAVAVIGPGPRPPAIPIRVNVAPVAPGIFTASSDGKGLPAAQLIRVRPDGSQATESVTASGIRIGGDTVYLVLYGTGIRNRTSLAGVACTIGGLPATVSYAGPQPESPGLDQVNVQVPAALAGRGDVTLVLSVDGQAANPVTLKIAG